MLFFRAYFQFCQNEHFEFTPVKPYFVFRLKVTFSFSRYGLDLIDGSIRDSKKAGVLEPSISKLKSLKFATEAAITILRIDDMIKLAPEEKDENTYQNAVARGQMQ